MWVREHEELVEGVDTLRKALETQDVSSLLRLAELSDDISLECIKPLLIAELIRSRGILDQTKKG